MSSSKRLCLDNTLMLHLMFLLDICLLLLLRNVEWKYGGVGCKPQYVVNSVQNNPQCPKYLQMIIDEVTLSFFACYRKDNKCKHAWITWLEENQRWLETMSRFLDRRLLLWTYRLRTIVSPALVFVGSAATDSIETRFSWW